MPINQKGLSPLIILVLVGALIGASFIAGIKYTNSQKETKESTDAQSSGNSMNYQQDSKMGGATMNYVESQTSQPPVMQELNGKNYSNEKLGFSVYIPPGFIELESSLPISKNYPNPVPKVSVESANMSIHISAAPAPAGLSIKNSLGDGPGLQYDFNLLTNKNTQKIQIDGNDAIRGDAATEIQQGSTTDVITFHNNMIYEIYFYPVNPENTKIFDEFIESFEFTN